MASSITSPSSSPASCSAPTGKAVRDRAAVTAAAIVQIVANMTRAGLLDSPAALDDLRVAVEDDLRDEFADIARMTLSEIRRADG